MLAHAMAGAAEGDWLRADRQMAGRGRMGRAWASPLGNFYGSTLVRLRPQDPAPASLAFVAAIAVHATLAQLAPTVSATIKWPNDIMVGPAKLCGMLLERAGDGAVVVGIGVNLAFHPTDLPRPVTSLAALGAPVPTPDAFQVVLADQFDQWLARWRRDGLAAVTQAWIARAHPLGTPLSAALPDGLVVQGAFDGLAPDGALKLRLADGQLRAIHAGDIFLV